MTPPTGGAAEARLRRDLDAIVRAALAAVEPERLVRRALEAGTVELPDPAGDGDPDLLVLAVGKASAGMLRGVCAGPWGSRVGRCVLLAPADGAPVDVDDAGFPLDVFRGGHPLPDGGGVRGSRTVLEAVRGVGPGRGILLLLSGGGSALLTLPAPGVELDDVRAVTRLLLESGAEIGALNAVRKHLDRLKGGRLAREAAPVPVRAALISDVVGDPPDVIASGPVSPDPTTYRDALEVLERLPGHPPVPPAVRRHLEEGTAGRRPETPGPGDPCFDTVRLAIVGNAETAVLGARSEAERRGYRIRVLGTDLVGEAREVGADLGRRARRIRRGEEGPQPPCCVLAAGETTVTVAGDGRGGRNQEVALGAARVLDGTAGVLLASVGTDGVDGPTDAAGALATGSTIQRAGQAGLDPEAALTNNDAYPFFRTLGDLIVTGPTGTNVMDLQVILARG